MRRWEGEGACERVAAGERKAGGPGFITGTEAADRGPDRRREAVGDIDIGNILVLKWEIASPFRNVTASVTGVIPFFCNG
jgi:hypothetical protein